MQISWASLPNFLLLQDHWRGHRCSKYQRFRSGIARMRILHHIVWFLLHSLCSPLQRRLMPSSAILVRALRGQCEHCPSVRSSSIVCNSVADAWGSLVIRGLGYRSLRRAQRERFHRSGGGAHCLVWRVRSSAAEKLPKICFFTKHQTCCAELQSRL